MRDEIKIELAKPQDAEAILKLKQTAWLQTYPNEEHGVSVDDIRKKLTDEDIAKFTLSWEKAIASEKLDGDRVTFVARMDGKVVGYTQPCNEDGKRMLGAMYVLPEVHGQGIGGKLLSKAIEWHGRNHDIYLNVVAYNQKAIGFYEHFGFVKTGKILPEEFDEKQGIKLLAEDEMVLKAKP